jgi:hypothetical protein
VSAIKNLRFDKMLSSGVAAQLVVSRVVLSSRELVGFICLYSPPSITYTGQGF